MDIPGVQIRRFPQQSGSSVLGSTGLFVIHEVGNKQKHYHLVASTTYYQSDQIGSARMMTSGGGWPVWQAEYAPYGQEINPQATTNNYKFTGKERDSESGLDHFQFRSYSSTMGRWMSPDPSQLYYADPANPQSLNLYSYVLNNPLKFIDPDGLACQWDDGTQDDSPSDGGINYEGCVIQGGTWNELTTINVTADNNENQLNVTQFDSSGTFIKPSNGTPATSNPPPCAPSGSAPAPTVYQQRGQQANNMTNAYDPYGMSSAAGAMYNAQNFYQFKRGGPLDAQVRYGGSTAYANYVFGVYLSAAGWTLQQTLSAANDYAAARSSYPNHPSMDPNYPSTPASNVANITAGYNAQQSGTLCHK